MNTFLPYSDFAKSAKVLDNKRLGKQRVEAWQIYLALTQENYGWKNHPIVKMWKGYEKALLMYGIYVCEEWKRRGYKDTMYDRFSKEFSNFESKFPEMHGENQFPVWLGYEPFHKSHRAKLYWKSPKYYDGFCKDYAELMNINTFYPDNIAEPDYLWFIGGEWS